MLLVHPSGPLRMLLRDGQGIRMRPLQEMGNENRNEHPVKCWNVQFVPNSVHLSFILWVSPPCNGGCNYGLENCFGDISSISIGNRDTDLGTKKRGPEVTVFP